MKEKCIEPSSEEPNVYYSPPLVSGLSRETEIRHEEENTMKLLKGKKLILNSNKMILKTLPLTLSNTK